MQAGTAGKERQGEGRRGGDKSRDADRIVLVDQLWKLKKKWQEHTGAHIPLDMLIKEAGYRRDLLDNAERSGKDELVALVRRIRSMEERLGEVSSINENGNRHAVRWPQALLLAAGAMIVAATLTGFFLHSSPRVLLPATDARISFRLHGSNTVGESLAPALLEAFYRNRNTSEVLLLQKPDPVERELQYVLRSEPDIAQGIEIKAHGSSTAFSSLERGLADLGMSSRRIKAGEAQELLERHGDLLAPANEQIIALDGLAVIVNGSNPVDSLTRGEIAQIFSGAIANWSEVGGLDQPITLYARDDKSGTFDTFKSLVLEPSEVTLSVDARRFESSTELADLVASDAGGIGFIGLPYVRQARALGINESPDMPAIVPTEFTVSTEEYPLARRLYLYVPAQASAEVREFVEFAQSEAGQAIVERSGLVAQRIRIESARPREDAPIEYQEAVENARRLSLVIRFASDGRLDNKSLRDVQRLIEFMKQHRDESLLLLGFVNDTGTEAFDVSQSRAHALMLEQILVARGIPVAEVHGFGGALPLVSREAPDAEWRNRRVEIWLR